MHLDQKDIDILNKRQAAFMANRKPKSGDFVRFGDGTLKRITHVWTDENGNADAIQTNKKSGDGSFYLGDGYMSYSGGLEPGISATPLLRTGEAIQGECWFFHHDFARAQNGIDVKIYCPVWKYKGL